MTNNFVERYFVTAKLKVFSQFAITCLYVVKYSIRESQVIVGVIFQFKTPVTFEPKRLAE